MDMLSDTPKTLMEKYMSSFTAKQTQILEDFCRRVPMGIFLIVGAAGTGKSTFVSNLMKIFAAGNKTISVTAPTNIAADRIMAKVTEGCCEDNWIIVRPWDSMSEEIAVLRFDYTIEGWAQYNEDWKTYSKKDPLSPKLKWKPAYSLAEWVLKLARIIPLENKTLESLEQWHKELCRILITPKEVRTKKEKDSLRSLTRQAFRSIVSVAHIIGNNHHDGSGTPYSPLYQESGCCSHRRGRLHCTSRGANQLARRWEVGCHDRRSKTIARNSHE